MYAKIKKFIIGLDYKRLRDVRVLGQIVFIIIGLLVAWSGLTTIQQNYQLQQQIARLNEQTKLQQLENDNIKLKNQYFSTDTYKELTARKQFGKAAPGETVVLVPESVALSHSVDPLAPPAADKSNPPPEKPFYQRNFEAWMNFFLHRTTQD